VMTFFVELGFCVHPNGIRTNIYAHQCNSDNMSSPPSFYLPTVASLGFFGLFWLT
jgi:hypothetical protein